MKVRKPRLKNRKTVSGDYKNPTLNLTAHQITEAANILSMAAKKMEQLLNIPVQTEFKYLNNAFIIEAETKKQIPFNDIRNVVCKTMGVYLTEVFTSNRKKELSVARIFIAYHIRQTNKNNTLEEIGKYMGKRDHTSVINMLQRYKELSGEAKNIRREHITYRKLFDQYKDDIAQKIKQL